MVVRIIKKEGIWADTFNQTRRTKKLNANRSPLKFSRRINSGTVHLPRAFHKKSECIPVVILPACVGEDKVCETWLSTLLCDVTGSVVNSKMKDGIRTKSRFFFSVTLSYSYHVLTSSVMYFWTDARHHGISWIVNYTLWYLALRSVIRAIDEGLTLETSVFKLFTVANLRFQLVW